MGVITKDKTTYKDLMSYCNPTWISDYTYKKILHSGQGVPSAPGITREAPRESCLLVWGSAK
jgi:hypothetical protein